jgi:magnesium-transporting ATPase (P-type)
MYPMLRVFAIVLGALLTSGVIYTIITIFKQRKKQPDKLTYSQTAARYFLRWSFFDYAVILVFLCGMIFLLVEVIAVLKDKASFPYHHYGYLLSGFIFSLLGMIFLLVRFVIVLRLVRDMDRFSFVNNHHEPNKADTAENGI